MSEQVDEDLMVAYQKGEVRAFEVLLSRHRKPVFNFILRFVGDRETAEDLLQEAFMRVIKGAEAYKRQAKFTTWLYTIARNLCVDQTRRRKHRKHASLDAPMDSSEESGTLLDVIPGNEMASDRKSVNKQLHEQMQQAIAALSDDQREVFLMREFLDMPFKQIADVVGVPENTVKSRMRYALEKLRLELDEYKDMAKAAPLSAPMADDDDDPELRSLRAAWRSLPDEDPPERGIAELMAAARQQAEVMAETRTPWWKRAVATMMRPPMLALASVLVLLGGVFVVTSSHKGVSPEPAPIEERAAPAIAPAAVPPPIAPVTPTAPIGGATEEPTTAAAPTPVPSRAPAPPPPRPAKTVRHAAPAAKPKPVDTISDPFASSHDDESGPGGAKEPPAMAPAPAATKRDADGEADEPSSTRGAVAKKPAGDPSTPRRQLDDQLLAECRAAATRGDCELVKKIARRIATDDAAYYGANVTTDTTISACLGK